jgi:hypothetical protein
MNVKFGSQEIKNQFLDIVRKSASSKQATDIGIALEHADALELPGVITADEFEVFVAAYKEYVGAGATADKFDAGWGFEKLITKIDSRVGLKKTLQEMEQAEVVGGTAKSWDPSAR